jgi:hypothetical protein
MRHILQFCKRRIELGSWFKLAYPCRQMGGNLPVQGNG